VIRTLACLILVSTLAGRADAAPYTGEMARLVGVGHAAPPCPPCDATLTRMATARDARSRLARMMPELTQSAPSGVFAAR